VGEEGAEPLVMRDYMYTVGSGSLTDGVDEMIVGLRAGEDLTLNGPLGPGQVATYALNLKKVQERRLPEVNDEWVAENTEWTTEEEMRDAIVDQMRRRRIVEAQLSQRDALLVALSELVPEDAAPEVLVDDETRSRLHDLSHRLEQQNLTLETFLQMTAQQPDDLLEALRNDARRAVRVDLALRAVVRAEGLEPSDEDVEAELVTTAEAMGATPEALRTNLRDTGRVVAFRAEVAKMKATRWLSDTVTFVDGAGVEIDRDLLRQDQSPETDA
jgi:trigger factor